MQVPEEGSREGRKEVKKKEHHIRGKESQRFKMRKDLGSI